LGLDPEVSLANAYTDKLTDKYNAIDTKIQKDSCNGSNVLGDLVNDISQAATSLEKEQPRYVVDMGDALMAHGIYTAA